MRGRPPCAQGFGGDLVDVAVGLQDVGEDKDVFGLLGEQGKVVGGEGVVDLGVVFVDGAGDAGQGGIDAFAQHGDEDAAELLDGFGGAVVGVHEVFYVGFQAALGMVVYRIEAA